IYGTSLEFEARAAKIALQKQFIRDLWVKASAAATAGGKTQIDVDILKPVLQAAVPYVQTSSGDWIVHPNDAKKTDITSRDRRQYGTVAYALRALLAVQQDAFGDGTNLVPLDPAAVALFKESVDLTTLAALQHADHAARTANRDRISAADVKTAWSDVVGTNAVPSTARLAEAPAPHAATERFATINAVVAEKLAAFEKYNDLTMPAFPRN